MTKETHSNLAFRYELLHRDGHARQGVLHTPHGTIETPAFMPVGTQATVKGVLPQQLREIGAQIILGNTYHLLLRPGLERIRAAGGLAEFMGWRRDGARAMLTDSGGYQVMSLAATRKIEEDGVRFASPHDGSKLFLTPQSVVEAQLGFRSTIAMVLDVLTEQPSGHAEHAAAMQQSMRWAATAHAVWRGAESSDTALFGIVQGGHFADLRTASVEQLLELDFPGYAIGGLAVGEPTEQMLATLAHAANLLPSCKPRYAMGLGTPYDLVEAVARGVDMMDCVLPTRSGRTGRAYTWQGHVNVRNAQFADLHLPIDADCPCYACRNITHAYLHHLFRTKEMLGPMLLTMHNLTFYLGLMRKIRSAIAEGSFATLRTKIGVAYNGGVAS